jgi:hypothetical protein
VTAVRAVAKRMDAAGLGDVKLVVACDAPRVSLARFGPMLEAKDLVGRVLALSTHTYGDGDEGDATPGWYDGESERAALVKAVGKSPHAGARLWMTSRPALGGREEVCPAAGSGRVRTSRRGRPASPLRRGPRPRRASRWGRSG